MFSSGRLSPAARALVLFCLHCLVGDDGTLNDTYQRFLDRYGIQDGHWCAGMPMTKLRHTASQFLGKAATRAPKWPEIDELFTVALAPGERDRLLAIAAGVFCQVKNLDRPPGYTGPIVVPEWAFHAEVTAETIKQTIADHSTAAPAAQSADDTDEAPPAEAPAGEPEPGEPLSATRDPEKLRQTMQILSRGSLSLFDTNEQLRERIRRLEEDAQASWQLRSENSRLTRLVEDLLVEQHYALTREEVRQLLTERLGATRVHSLGPARSPRRRPVPRPPHADRHLAAHPPA